MAIDTGIGVTYDPAFPVAGKSQGTKQFRDNFEAIRIAIENLQSMSSVSASVLAMTTTVSADGRVVARLDFANNALKLPSGNPSIDAVAGMIKYDGGVQVHDGAQWRAIDPIRRLVFAFETAVATWTINHNLGRYPGSMMIYDDAGKVLSGTVTNPTVNRTVVTLTEPKKGSVVLLG